MLADSPLVVSHGVVKADTGDHGPVQEFGLARLEPLRTLSPHIPFLHVMLSYRVETEGSRAPGNQLVKDIYEKLHALSLTDHIVPITGLGVWPSFCAPPKSSCPRHCVKVFWDEKCLPDGQSWMEGFVNGVANSVVFVPLLSWDERDKGSLGGLINLNRAGRDYVDNVLLELILALEIRRIPGSCVRAILPILFSQKTGDTWASFDFKKL